MKKTLLSMPTGRRRRGGVSIVSDLKVERCRQHVTQERYSPPNVPPIITLVDAYISPLNPS